LKEDAMRAAATRADNYALDLAVRPLLFLRRFTPRVGASARRHVLMDDELPRTVKTTLRAVADGDTDRFLECFLPYGSVNDWGCVFKWHECIRHWSDWEFIGVGASLRVLDITTSGEVTVVAAEVGGSGFNGRSDFSFTVSDDQILEMKITA
jgi:hypothetical protein